MSTSRVSQLARHFTMAKTPTDITLYTAATPNGIKASILLAELNLDYKVPIHPPFPTTALTSPSFTPSA